MSERSDSAVGLAIRPWEAGDSDLPGHTEAGHPAASHVPRVGHAVISRELLARVDLLLQEFGPRVSAGAIIRTFAVSVRELQATGLTSGLTDAAEAMARHRLSQSQFGPPGHARSTEVGGEERPE